MENEKDLPTDNIGSSPESVKPRFSEVCQTYTLDYQAMRAIANKAKVPKHVVDAMSVSTAVRRVHALKVLAALSEHTGQTWTLDTVKVALLPTFQDFHTLHQFDLILLSATSGVSFDTIGMMLRGEPVPTREASRVLLAASKQTRLYYKLTNVDITLTDGEENGYG